MFKTNIEQAAIYDQLLNSLKLSSKSSLIRNYEHIHEEIEHEMRTVQEKDQRLIRSLEN